MLKFWFKFVLFNLGAVFLLTALSELSLFLLYRYPPDALLAASRSYYLNWDRNELSYQESCSKHHPLLSYILKPGKCRFWNREFSTTVSANSAGFRDDEESLHNPKIIAIGDSLTFAWGVEAKQGYTSILEEVSGQKVLNVSMPSFGTARELIALRNLDLSKAGIVTIQYCENDIRENREFVTFGGSLRVMRPQDYALKVNQAKHKQPNYKLGKYLTSYLAHLRSFFANRQIQATQKENNRFTKKSVKFFIKSLEYGRSELEGKQILVFEINGYNQNMGPFIAELKKRIARGVPEWMKIDVLDLSRVLEDSDFYRLDDHMLPSGHRKVAAEINRWINENKES